MRSSPRRSPGAFAVGTIAAACLATICLASCSSPQSFIVLVVESSTPTPITGVAQLTVAVSKGTTQMKTLTFGAGDLTLTADADINSGTLSVSFSGDETGDITFDVKALDAQGCVLGERTVIVTIKKGATNEGIVPLVPGTGCGHDGGAPDGGDGGGLGGCNLVHPQCAVANQTCQIDCTAKVQSCVMGGATPAGGVCNSSADCASGTQCFDYTPLGCAIKVCLPFCDGNTDCSSFGGGVDGGGPGSFCRDPVVCPGLATAAHTCSFNCDPTAAAVAANNSGCPAGLACLVSASMDEVDCFCAEATRTGQEGDPCTNSAGCARGLICNARGGVQSCRPICRCDAVGGSCTAANDCLTANTHCTVVTNQTIYGICL